MTEINFHSTEGKEISDPSFPILLLSRHSTTTFLTPDSHQVQNGHPGMDEHNEPSAVSSDSVFFGVEAGSESSSADKTGSICLPGLNQLTLCTAFSGGETLASFILGTVPFPLFF